MPIKTLLTTLALAVPLALQAAEKPKVVDLVQVNGTKVNNLDLAIFSTQATGNQKADSPEQQAAILEELVNIFMLAHSKEGKKLKKHREVAAALKVANARLIAETLVRKKMQDAKISEQAIKTAYQEQYVKAPKIEYKARHILLKTEKDAKDVITALKTGKDFAALAKEKSTGPSKTVGGDLGWFNLQQMVPPFSDALAKMTKNTYSQQPVKTQYGWHVILLEDTRKMPTQKLDQVRDKLIQHLKAQKVGEYIRNIREKSNITIFAKKPAQKAK